MTQKNLWYIARADLSQPGTAEAIHSREDVAGLRDCGWDAFLLSSAYAPNYVVSDASTIVLTRKKTKLERLAFELKVCIRLLQTANRPNFVFFRGPTNLILIGLFARWLKIPFGMELNGVLGYRYEEKSGLRGRVESLIDTFFMENSSVLIGVTPELTDLARREANPGAVIATAPNAVNLYEIKPVKPKCSEKDLMLGFLGMAYQSRGLEHAVDAIAILNQRGIKCGLRCVGGGPNFPELRELAARKGVTSMLELQMAVPPAEMAAAVADCDIMWASYEPWKRHKLTGLSPLKIWTYLALAKPVLVRDPGGVLGAYRDVPGLIWNENGDGPVIAQQLEILLQKHTREEFIKLGMSGRMYVETQVSWSRHCQIIIKAINKALDAELLKAEAPI